MTIPRVAAFAGVGTLGIAVQLATVAAGMRWGHLDAPVATAVGVAAAIAHNFVWHRRWTWGDRRSGGMTRWTMFLRFTAATAAISLIGNVVIVSLLVREAAVPGLAANVIAIVVCAGANYWASDRLVFTSASFGP